MRSDAAVFILTHGRPDKQRTLHTLRRYGFQGRWYLVLDDADKTIAAHEQMYGKEHIAVFSKEEVAKWTDEGNNQHNRKAILYARNACWSIAREVKTKYFFQFDDDYGSMSVRDMAGMFTKVQLSGIADEIFDKMIAFYESSQALAIAMLQGGDYIGFSGSRQWRLGHAKLRKCMNSWLCSVDRPFQFTGTVNEDATAYVSHGRRGQLFLSVPGTCVDQAQTQAVSGGMSEVYLSMGTYFKSATSVMIEPSACKIAAMGDARNDYRRIHHAMIDDSAYPKIVQETLVKGVRLRTPAYARHREPKWSIHSQSSSLGTTQGSSKVSRQRGKSKQSRPG